MLKNETMKNNNNESIKVKIYYSLRGSKTTRLSLIHISNQENLKDSSLIPIPLKTCLWSICTSSPDIICKDHDLSIYTANYKEMNILNEKSTFIWEGHGLMSWIMDESTDKIYVYGRPHQDQNYLEICIELHPTMRWVKNDFLSAIKNKSFEQFKNFGQSPLVTHCNCYGYDDNSNKLLIQESPQDEHKSSPPIPSRLPSLSSSVPIFRPEPIFPATPTTPNRLKGSEGELTLPIPNSYPDYTRRSAFTIAGSTEAKTTATTTTAAAAASSSSSSSVSPPTKKHVLSHEDEEDDVFKSKKRRKDFSFIMPAEPSNEPYPFNYPQFPVSQPQQVNTAVRTYYEIERDSQGDYILPVDIDSWTVVDLGTVIYDRPAYHNQRYIYPVNYTVRKRAFAIRNQEYGHNPVGPDFFGFRKNTIAKMIQDLPNASKCSQYIWQTFEPARFNKPGRNRRRADSSVPASLLGGVNYGLTSSRLIHNTNLTQSQQSFNRNNALYYHHQQPQQQKENSASPESNSTPPIEPV